MSPMGPHSSREWRVGVAADGGGVTTPARATDWSVHLQGCARWGAAGGFRESAWTLERVDRRWEAGRGHIRLLWPQEGLLCPPPLAQVAVVSPE